MHMRNIAHIHDRIASTFLEKCGRAVTSIDSRAPFGQVGRSALTDTLWPHFGLTDNLWFTTALQGAKGAAVSKGLVERYCHHMLQNAAIICVKSHHVSCRRGRLHVRGHAGEDVVGARGLSGFCRLAAAQQAIHFGDDVGGVGGRRDAQQVMLLEVLSGVVAQPLFDLLRKAVEVRVAVDVEPRQDLHQVQNIGDQASRGSATPAR